MEFILREGSQRLGAYIALGANRESEARHRLVAFGLDMGHEVVVPQSEIKILHLGAAFAGQRSGGFGPMGRILDLRDPLLGVVEQHDVFGHVSSP